MGAHAQDSTILWGAANIAAFLGVTTAAAFHMLEGGKIPARRVGRRWAADPDTLRRYLSGADEKRTDGENA